MKQVIRTRDEQEHGLVHRYIFGLSTFRFNRVPYTQEDSPETIFLTALSNQTYCSVQVGAVSLEECEINSPEAVFGPSNEGKRYFQTRVGFNDGFFDLNSVKVNKAKRVSGCTIRRRSTFGDCFFPQATPELWYSLNKIPGFQFAHGLVLYISPINDSENFNATMRQMVSAPFPGVAPWLQAVTSLYTVLLHIGHDGEYFHAWAKNHADLALLNDPLSKAEASIINSRWYKDNEARLVWSESPYLITVHLPSAIR